MKVFLLKDVDLERLLLMVDRNPAHGHDGGSSQTFNAEERKAHDEAHRFYNYQVRTWVNQVKQEE